MIDWAKQNGECPNTTSDYIREMGAAVDDLCKKLSVESKEFDPKVFFEALHSYIQNEGRLLYTNISNYIFSLEKEEEFGTIQTNLDKTINYIYGEEFQKEYTWEPNPYGKTKRTVLKIWDHVNLAQRQCIYLKMTDNDFNKIVNEKMEVAELKMTKEVSGQLISLVSIFTALSFLLFGGISSLDNIFSAAKNDIPITKLMLIGTIWCFCIMNMIYVFMFFIALLTGLNIKSSQNVNANLVQKYPLICWCNFVLLTILLLSGWAYYVKNEGISGEIYHFLARHSNLYFISGTGVIIAIIIIAAYKIYKLSKAK